MLRILATAGSLLHLNFQFDLELAQAEDWGVMKPGREEISSMLNQFVRFELSLKFSEVKANFHRYAGL